LHRAGGPIVPAAPAIPHDRIFTKARGALSQLADGLGAADMAMWIVRSYIFYYTGATDCGMLGAKRRSKA
jgi:hypothetical protein